METQTLSPELDEMVARVTVKYSQELTDSLADEVAVRDGFV